jgi:hypothetical protein
MPDKTKKQGTGTGQTIAAGTAGLAATATTVSVLTGWLSKGAEKVQEVIDIVIPEGTVPVNIEITEETVQTVTEGAQQTQEAVANTATPQALPVDEETKRNMLTKAGDFIKDKAAEFGGLGLPKQIGVVVGSIVAGVIAFKAIEAILPKPKVQADSVKHNGQARTTESPAVGH